MPRRQKMTVCGIHGFTNPGADGTIRRAPVMTPEPVRAPGRPCKASSPRLLAPRVTNNCHWRDYLTGATLIRHCCRVGAVGAKSRGLLLASKQAAPRSYSTRRLG